MGLFDTVNSVPKFESAWMQRSKFSYTAKLSAKVIRHAVSIDERRAKFRQDLISGDQPQREDRMSPDLHRYNSDLTNTSIVNGPDARKKDLEKVDKMKPHIEEPEAVAEKSNGKREKQNVSWLGVPKSVGKKKSDDSFTRPGDSNQLARGRLMSMAMPMSPSTENLRNQYDEGQHKPRRHQYSEAQKKQNIEEVWFAGGHADIGGGWAPSNGEKWMLSHAPLVWMVHEAAKAGLPFDHA